MSKDCPSQSQNIHLLLVDDEAVVLDATKAYLTTCYHFRVDTALSGPEALACIADTKYDAVILDYDMEGMDGLLLLQAIREQGYEMPVLIFTGKGREEVVISAYDMGADGYVQKGGDIRSQFAELAHKITTAVKKRQTEHDLQKAQKQLREIHRQACIGIWDWDMHQDRIFWSDELYQIIGWEPNLSPPGYSDLKHLYVPESWDRLQAAVTTSIETGNPYDLELEHFRPDKTRIWVHATGGPVYDSTGKLTGLHGTLQDITQVIKDKKKIELHAKRLEALLNLNHIADAQVDLIFEYALQASCDITVSQFSFFGLVDPDESIMTIHNWSKNAMTGCAIPQNPIEYPINTAGIWGEAVRNRSPVMINEYGAPHPKKKGLPAGHVPIHRFLTVPIFDQGRIAAVLCVANKSEEYDDEDVSALTAFGNELWRIIDHKRTEKALLESEERFRQLFNNASDAIYLHAFTQEGPGNFFEVNDAACEMLGYTREELLRLQVTDINTPESNAMIPRLFPLIFENMHIRFECTHNRKDGGVVPVEASVHLFSLLDKPVVLSVSRDISERKHDEKIREAILSGLKDIYVEYIDRNMNVIWVNQAIRDRYGLSSQSSPGFCYQFVQGRDSPCPGCTAIMAMETGAYQEGEVTTPDGHHFIVRSNPVIENGVVTGVIHIGIDITEQKTAEQALRQANRQLNMLSDITRHDIVNTLNAMELLLDLVRTKVDASRAIQEFEHIYHAISVIQSQIEFTRVYQDLGFHMPVWHHLPSLIQTVLKKSPYQVMSTAEEFSIYADPLVVKVFENLLDNSIRHGKTVSRISLFTLERNGELIIVYEDDGTGIPTEEKEEIFERGYGKNTGFGLFFIREILAVTNISIRECGEPGRGVRFEMTVPAGGYKREDTGPPGERTGP